jgi:hypothetical protein
MTTVMETWAVTTVNDEDGDEVGKGGVVIAHQIPADRITVDGGCLLVWIGEEVVCGWGRGAWRSFAKLVSR